MLKNVFIIKLLLNFTEVHTLFCTLSDVTNDNLKTIIIPSSMFTFIFYYFTLYNYLDKS